MNLIDSLNPGYVVPVAVLGFAYWMAFATESSRRKVVHFFVAKLSEQVLFLYSFTVILFLLSDKKLNDLIVYPITHFENAFWILLPIWLFGLGMLILGLGLPIYHAFSHRRKSRREKIILIYFALIAQGAVGMASGAYAIFDSESFLDTLLPLWNLLTGIVLFLLLRLNEVGEDFVDDKNTKLTPVVFGVLIVFSLFYLNLFVLQSNWATGMSMCFVYIQSVNDRVLHAMVRILS